MWYFVVDVVTWRPSGSSRVSRRLFICLSIKSRHAVTLVRSFRRQKVRWKRKCAIKMQNKPMELLIRIITVFHFELNFRLLFLRSLRKREKSRSSDWLQILMWFLLSSIVSQLRNISSRFTWNITYIFGTRIIANRCESPEKKTEINLSWNCCWRLGEQHNMLTLSIVDINTVVYWLALTTDVATLSEMNEDRVRVRCYKTVSWILLLNWTAGEKKTK